MTVDLLSINALPSATIMAASSYFTKADQTTGEPQTVIIRIALDKEKANSVGVDFPLYLNAEGNYKTVPYIEMQNLFRKGAPFVPIKCTNLKIYYSQINNQKEYFATASKFEVVEYSEVEDIL